MFSLNLRTVKAFPPGAENLLNFKHILIEIILAIVLIVLKF